MWVSEHNPTLLCCMRALQGPVTDLMRVLEILWGILGGPTVLHVVWVAE